MRSKLERFGNIEPPRLRDNLDVLAVWEAGIDRLVQVHRSLLKKTILKAPTHIQEGKVIAGLLRHVEDLASTENGVGVDGGIVAPASNVEADTDNVEFEFLSLGQEGGDDVEGRAELDAKSTETLGVVG